MVADDVSTICLTYLFERTAPLFFKYIFITVFYLFIHLFIRLNWFLHLQLILVTCTSFSQSLYKSHKHPNQSNAQYNFFFFVLFRIINKYTIKTTTSHPLRIGFRTIPKLWCSFSLCNVYYHEMFVHMAHENGMVGADGILSACL